MFQRFWRNWRNLTLIWEIATCNASFIRKYSYTGLMIARNLGHGTCFASDYELCAWMSYNTHLVGQHNWKARILYDTWPLMRWKYRSYFMCNSTKKEVYPRHTIKESRHLTSNYIIQIDLNASSKPITWMETLRRSRTEVTHTETCEATRSENVMFYDICYINYVK